MNFFAAQQKAKNATFKLLFLFVLGLIGIIATAVLALVAVIHFNQDPQYQYYSFLENLQYYGPSIAIYLIPAILVITVIASLIKWLLLRRNGGKAVAETLGGKLIHQESEDLNERKVLNVVEEMAIASGVSVPPVYLLEDESINAFAAGFSPNDVVIGVTRGAITKLKRDELQGVIAHEFSHIFNGDMKINMKMTGIIFGLIFLALTGRIIFRVALYSGSGDRDSGKAKMIAFALGLVFIIVGYIGYFFGHIIQAAVSRQREYLADATAVQYTRDTKGIANALKRIGGNAYGSTISDKHAGEFAHYYFANGDVSFMNRMLATHPPLEDRILALDKEWDGKYLSDEIKEQPQKEDTQNKKKKEQIISTAAVMSSLGNIGTPNVEAAHELLAAIPDMIKKEINSTLGSITVVLALFAHKDEKERAYQLNEISKVYPQNQLKKIKDIIKELSNVDEYSDLVIAELCVPHLRQLSPDQYTQFRKVVNEMIMSDDKIEIFEWMLSRIVISQLDIVYGLKKEPKDKYSSASIIKNDIAKLLSKVAFLEYKNDDISKKAVDSLKPIADLQISYINSNEFTTDDLDIALDNIAQAYAETKKEILERIVELADQNGTISPIEMELIKTISLSLGLPLPPVNLIVNNKE